jgi:polyisoprenoid-binding protein YceI
MKTQLKMTLSILTVVTALSTSAVWAEIATPGKYKIDPAHTSANFKVNHLGFSELSGRFNSMSGHITFSPNGQSQIRFEIKTNSVDTNHTKRDKHLRSPDFFNAKLYPLIRFTSDNVVYNKKGDPITATGKLNLHGQSKIVTLDISTIGAGKDPWGGYRSGYNASTVIKRSDFGMNFMLGGIGDDIEINLHIEAIKI